jgi:hypothetical protein
MKKILTIALCFSVLILARPGYCWDGVGHELVAQIAYDLLTPAARAQVNHLSTALNTDPFTIELAEPAPFNAVTIATWPDEIKGLGAETRKYSPWHYIDLDSLPAVKSTADAPGVPGLPIADSATIAAVKSYTNPDSDVYEQILAQSKILADKTAATADRARALAFVEHFVGDVHQPLHSIGRQRGGNSYDIDLTVPGRHISNLHSFWDGAYRYHVVNNEIVIDPLYPTSRDVVPDTGDINSWADVLIKNDLPTNKVILKQQDPAAWAVESSELATSFAFPSDNTPNLSMDYVQKAGDLARERLALAGYRLANLLNSLLN